MATCICVGERGVVMSGGAEWREKEGARRSGGGGGAVKWKSGAVVVVVLFPLFLASVRVAVAWRRKGREEEEMLGGEREVGKD